MSSSDMQRLIHNFPVRVGLGDATIILKQAVT